MTDAHSDPGLVTPTVTGNPTLQVRARSDGVWVLLTCESSGFLRIMTRRWVLPQRGALSPVTGWNFPQGHPMERKAEVFSSQIIELTHHVIALVFKFTDTHTHTHTSVLYTYTHAHRPVFKHSQPMCDLSPYPRQIQKEDSFHSYTAVHSCTHRYTPHTHTLMNSHI